MTSEIRVKICGLRDAATLGAAVDAGANYVGFVFFDKSPRNITVQEARSLAIAVPPGVAKVALVVNATNDALDELLDAVPIDILQLHGSESPERVQEIRRRYGLPVMKAVGVSSADDVARFDTYSPVANQLLIDAKPTRDAKLPGGNGLSFDWRLISNLRWSVPWMLAGGLTPQNVAQAIALTGAKQVDVSSGVETAPGVKDPALIRRFIDAAKSRSAVA